MWIWLLPLGFGVAGLLLGRWWVAFVAAATWIGIAIFLRVNNGWYGHGWGDYGVALNVFVAFLTVSASAIGVLVRKALRGWMNETEAGRLRKGGGGLG